MLGSVGLHVAVIASLVDAPPELPDPPPVDELVTIAVMGTESTSLPPRELGPSVEDVPAPAPGGEIEDALREPEPPAPPEAKDDPRDPPPAPEPAAARPSAPAEPAVDPEPPMPGADALPIPERDDDGPDVTPEAAVAEPERDTEGAGVVDARGTGASDARGGGTYDASAYGKEIVRLVLDELDVDPVPGLGRTDSIRVVLRVKPDGSLAWPASGRYGFAMVLGSTVGPIRTRAFLKRIERASARFPPHPTGLKKRRYYEMELTFKFTRALARG